MPKAALVTDLIVNEENRYGAIAPNKSPVEIYGSVKLIIVSPQL